GLFAWIRTGRSRAGLGLVAVFVAAIFVGLIPREIGRRIDPFDAYPSQFQMTLERQAILEHCRIFGLYCLPRLIAGTELTQLENFGTTIQAMGSRAISSRGLQMRAMLPGKAEWLALLFLGAFMAAVVRLVRDSAQTTSAARTAVSLAALAS